MMPIFEPGRQTFKGERKSAHQRQGAADRGEYRQVLLFSFALKACPSWD
jgi:hypothetical protein